MLLSKGRYEVYPRLKDFWGFTFHRTLLGGYSRTVTKINILWFDVKVIRKRLSVEMESYISDPFKVILIHLKQPTMT